MKVSFPLGMNARPGCEFEIQPNYFLIVGLGLDFKPQCPSLTGILSPLEEAHENLLEHGTPRC